MNSRFDYGKIAPGVYDAMDALDRYVQTCAVEKALIMLVQFRVSLLHRRPRARHGAGPSRVCAVQSLRPRE